MDRWNLMFIRAYAPSMAFMAAATLLLWLLPKSTDSPFLAIFTDIFRWLPLTTLAIGSISALWATFRLWQWQQGHSLTCGCGGLLGRERAGIRGRTDYRKCLACGQNWSSRHYE